MKLHLFYKFLFVLLLIIKADSWIYAQASISEIIGDTTLYDRPFKMEGERCYCLNFTQNAVTIKDDSGYVELRVVDSWENIGNLELDKNSKPYLPKGVNQSNAISNKFDYDEIYEEKVSAYTRNRTDLDTLFLYRDHISSRLVLNKNKLPLWYYEIDKLDYGEMMCMVELPYEPFVFIIAMDESDPRYTQLVKIEVGSDDILTTDRYLEVLCPSKFNKVWLDRLVQGLSASGYLSNMPRISFDIDVRNALYRFQRNNKIQVGYIDRMTLELLGVEGFF